MSKMILCKECAEELELEIESFTPLTEFGVECPKPSECAGGCGRLVDARRGIAMLTLRRLEPDEC